MLKNILSFIWNSNLTVCLVFLFANLASQDGLRVKAISTARLFSPIPNIWIKAISEWNMLGTSNDESQQKTLGNMGSKGEAHLIALEIWREGKTEGWRLMMMVDTPEILASTRKRIERLPLPLPPQPKYFWRWTCGHCPISVQLYKFKSDKALKALTVLFRILWDLFLFSSLMPDWNEASLNLANRWILKHLLISTPLKMFSSWII